MFSKLSEIFNTRNIDAVDELFSAKYVDHQRPEWMTQDGKEEFIAIVKLARDSMPGLQVNNIGPIIAENDMVVGRMYWSSKTVEHETIEILRIENGRFAEHWGAKAWSHKKDVTNE